MKHSFKRLLSMVLALAMVLSCVPVQAFAEECAHEYDIVITGPSCTEPGSMVYTCGLCGDTYEEAGEEPAGHDYAVEETPATCLEDGVVSYVCTVCGESETEEIGALGHCYVDGACEACGEADPEAEEPVEEPEEEPTEESEDAFVQETIAPVDADADPSQPTEDGGPVELPEEPVEDAVAQLGKDGKTFTTLEAAIEAAANIDIDERPFVSLLKDCTISETIVIDEAINIFYIGEDGNNPTVTAAEGVDTLFEITENGGLLVNNIDMETNGKYIIDITGENGTFQTGACNLSGATEAAINVAVDWNYPETDTWIPTTVQVYEGSVSSEKAVLSMTGSNASAVFALGNGTSVELTGNNADGLIVLEGDGHLVQIYEGTMTNKVADGKAFTMNGDSIIKFGGGSFNGDRIDECFNGWGEPMPQNGAVARLDIGYYGSLNSALDAANSGGYNSPLDILAPVTITDDVELNYAPIAVRNVLTVDGGTLKVNSPDLYISEEGTLKVIGGTLELNSNSMTTIKGTVNLDSDAALKVAGSHLMEVGSSGTLTVANSANVTLAEGDSIRVFLPGGTANGIDGLWGTYLVEEASQMQTAVDAFAENGDYVNYGIKEIAPYYSMTLTDHITIADDVRLLLYPWEGPVILTVPAGVTLTNNGEIYAGRDCHIVGDGDIDGNGTIIEEGITLPELQRVIYEAYYRGEREVWLQEDAVLDGALWIPEELQVFAENVTITVPQGQNLNLAGSGMNLLGTEMNVLGTLNTYAPLYVNDDSYLHIAGKGALTMESNSVVTIQGNMSLDAEATLSLSENAKIEVGSHGNLTAETDTEITSEGAIWVFLPGGTTTNIPKNAMEGVIYDPEDLDEALTTAATYRDQYSSVRLEIWDRIIHVDDETTIPANVVLALNNSGNGYYEELIVPEGQKLVNNGTIVLNEETALRIFGELENNGEIIVNMRACVNNYGDPDIDENDFILNGGEYYEGNMSQAALQAKLDELVTSNAGGWIHESVTRLEENMIIELGIRESDGAERTFRVAKYGQIIVPRGVTLTLNSPTMLNGGQIIVEDGGKLVVNRQLHIGSGTLYMENGAHLDVQNGGGRGILVTWENDDKPDHITAYNIMENWLDDRNSELYETIDHWDHGFHRESQILPGYGNHLIFYFNHWNDEDKIWERTPIHPDDMTVTRGLEIYSLKEDQGYQIQPGQRNGDCFVSVQVPYDESLWDTVQKIKHGGCEYLINVKRDERAGFYSEPVASNEAYLTDIAFGPGMSNTFYYIVTDENHPVTDIEVTLEAGPEIVENGVQFFKYADKVWLMKLSDEAAEKMDRNYWLSVKLKYPDGNGGFRGEGGGGINCFPYVWMRGMPDATIELNNQEYRYYYATDEWVAGCWVEDDSWPEGGFWSEYNTELPDGVNYDLDSNTLTLNNAHLENLGVSYYWYDEYRDEGGYNLPNPDLTIELIGENAIIDNDHVALGLRRELNATITGNGSLYVENSNNPGRVHNYNAADVENSTLTIGGSVDVTFAVEGENYWDNREPATMTGLDGMNGSHLIITDSAKVSFQLPEGPRFDRTNDNSFGYRGLANFDNVTVEKRATLNLDALHLENGHNFTQNGGTININDPGLINEEGRHWYEPLVVRAGGAPDSVGSTMQINGGTMNITLDDTSDNARGRVICVEDNSEMLISGGQIVINNNVRAPGIAVCSDSDLFFTGGTMYYNGVMFNEMERATFIVVEDSSRANFTGGTICVENSTFNFNSSEERMADIKWMGTNLIAKNTVIEQNGSFRMTSGKLNLTNSRFHSNNNTVFTGGIMDMDNSVLIVNGYTGVEGVALLDFDIDDGFYKAGFPDNCAIEVNSYFPIEGFAKINIDAALDEYSGSPFSGIRISAYKNDKGEVIVGGYHQMGGTVTINSNGAIPTIDSWGNIMLNAGTLNLTGTGGIHIAFAEEIFIDAYGEVNEDDKNFFDMWEGFALNVDAVDMGLELRTNSSIHGGNLNVKATGEGGVGVYVSNGAELYISGGNHNITANHNGIMIDNGSLVVEKEPEIHVEAGHAALYSRMENVDKIHIEFAKDSIFDKNASATANLWVKEDRSDDPSGYRYALSSDGENFAKSIRFNKAPMTLQEVLPELNAVDGRYQLKQAVIVEESMELDRVLDVLDGGKITVRNGATLTIPGGSAHLIAKKNGAVIVEAGGKIVNGGIMAADGGVIIVNSNGYEHMDGAILNSHFHEEPDGEGGYRLDLDSVRGIPEIYVNLDGTVDTTEGLQNVLAAAQNGYKEVRIWTANDMDLSDLYIPANTSMSIDGQEVRADVTVNEGTELYIDGQLNLGNVLLTVNGLLVNYNLIQTDPNDAAVIHVNGRVENHGDINLNKAELNIDSSMDNIGLMVVNNDSVVNVNGMLVNYGYLWSGIEGNGTVNVAGELNVHQNMTVYENGAVNVDEDAVLRVCNYYDDGMSCDNSHLDVYGTVNVDGTLENSGALNLYGTVNVAESGTLINDFEICMWDTKNQSGAELIVDGTFVNNVAMYNASYGGVVDVSNGNFINREANPDDPYDYDAEILTRYFEKDSIAAMNGIDNGIVILTYEGVSTTAANAMAEHAKGNGYATSLFRVDGAALVAAGEQLTVNTIVMLSGSQLGVNGGLTVNSLLRMRADTEMSISSSGIVNILGALRVDPADDYNGLEAAVLNNKGILECGAYGVLDICGEYNDSGVGNIYTNIVYDYDQEGYNQSGVWGDAWNIYQDAQVLVGSVDNEEQMRHVIDMVEADGYRSGIIRIDSEVTVHEELYIPANVTVEIGEDGALIASYETVITNDGTIIVDDNDYAVKKKPNGGYAHSRGTYGGYCGNDEAPEALTWTVKNNVLTISGDGCMGDYTVTEHAPWYGLANAINKVVLDSGVKSIGAYAFWNDDATVTIPVSVLEIGTNAFNSAAKLKVYHDSFAEEYVENSENGITENQILYFHVIDSENGTCTECDYSIYTILDSAAMPEKKVEEIKNIDTDTLKEAMEKAENNPENDLVDQLDQLEQEVMNVTGLDVGIKHSDDVSEEIADAFSNVHEDAAIVGAVLNAEEGVEEINLVIGDPEQKDINDEEFDEYNRDASVLFSMTMEGVGNASQLDVPVKITLPIPDSIFDLAKLVVKHFHAGGVEDLTNSCVVTVDEDGKAYVSFIVTGFSDFLLAQETTDVTLTAKVYPSKITTETDPDTIDIPVTAMAENEDGTKYRIYDLKTGYKIRNADGAEVTLEEALENDGEYTVIPTYVTDPQYNVQVFETKLIIEKVEYACVIGDEKYESITDALDAAKPGDVVRLIADTQTDEVLIVSADTTLDLNGHYITAKNVLGFGNIIDNKGSAAPLDVDGDEPSAVEDGTETGGIINGRSKAEFVTLSEGNGDYIPIYDTVTGSYKFFKELTAGTVNTADGVVIDSYDVKASDSNAKQVKFRFDMLFDNMEAYSVLNRTTNSGLRVGLDIYWTGIVGFKIDYTMSDSTVKSNAGSQYKYQDWKSHMALTVLGLQNIGAGNTISAVPYVVTQTGVTARAVENAAAQVYIIPEA